MLTVEASFAIGMKNLWKKWDLDSIISREVDVSLQLETSD